MIKPSVDENVLKFYRTIAQEMGKTVQEKRRQVEELIKDKLMQNKDVEFAGVMKTHPEIGQPRLIVKSGKNAKSLILKALGEVEEDIKDLSSQINKK